MALIASLGTVWRCHTKKGPPLYFDSSEFGTSSVYGHYPATLPGVTPMTGPRERREGKEGAGGGEGRANIQRMVGIFRRSNLISGVLGMLHMRKIQTNATKSFASKTCNIV